MTDLSKWFNEIADSIEKPDEMVEKIKLLTLQVKSTARHQAEINHQRDKLIARIANILGIYREDYPDFFDNI